MGSGVPFGALRLGPGPRWLSFACSHTCLSHQALRCSPSTVLPAPDTSPNQFSLYTFSLPNISLGLQATVTVTNSHLTVSTGHIPSGVEVFGPGPQLARVYPPNVLREIRRSSPKLGWG